LLSFGAGSFVFRFAIQKYKDKIYRTIILPIVLHECEISLLTMKEECRLRVFGNRVLRIFGPKRDEATGEWRKLHNDELNDLYSSPNIVRVINSRRMRSEGHVACMDLALVYTGFWWGNLRERDHLEGPDIDGRITLRWIFSKCDVMAWIGSIWLMIGTGGGHL